MSIDREPQHTLDCRNLFCPSPVLKAREAMDQMESGQLLRILASDPAAEEDIKSWAKWAGHQVLEFAKNGGELIFLVRKG